MRFLKTSIIILFLLSLSTAAVTFFLTNIRENEKEKRLYIEELKNELEEQVTKLQSQNSQLNEKVVLLETEKKAIVEKLKAETDSHQQVLSLLDEKDANLDTLRKEAEEAQIAFDEAQKRNQELERILDELESRVSEIESQKEVPQSEVAYLELKPEAASLAVSNPVAEEQKPAEIKEEEKPIEFTPAEEPARTPKKKRNFFSFLKKEDTASKPEKDPVPMQHDSIEPLVAPTVPQPPPPAPQPVQESKPAPVQQTQQTPKKTNQTIAAGSVLLVNRNYNFVVVNLGLRQGLSLNDVVNVERDNKEIAKARVEKLYDDYSAAYIVEEQSDEPIKEGDSVSAS